jgi:hypothetical protein
MLNSVLLHFGSPEHLEPTIALGVSLARRVAARVRGLTLVDTRRLATLSSTSEGACYTNSELDRLQRVEAEQDQARRELSRACLSAGLDFDVRRARGNPLEVLPPESQFHDLVVTSFPGSGRTDSEDTALSVIDIVDLLCQGVEPLLVVRSSQKTLRRVLLVNDGTASSARTIRQFVRQNLLPEAEVRLLAIRPSEEEARVSLREMADYCRNRQMTFEAGWLCGSPRRLLVPYAHKWGADLVVQGVRRGATMLRRLWREPAESILRAPDLALYAGT